ncbi:hypothetical protein PMZ80_003218 [Knufia obscura]|uniref:Lysine-specific metallo-endopeptidase domain-containing protein n=1 Tax=Knufia obscura TaxID=1635080 RepID=A0ABR0RTK7_9EURO|nr:hypothetical protein PMZ80_003218 [Knufia obscura]
MVLSAMIGSVSMMIETVKVIQQNPLHPSFQRYFRTEDLQMVVKIYENLLAVLGMQDYEHLRLCLRVNKLQIWYGDGPGQDLCATTGAHAYSWDYDDSGGFPHHYISYCRPFFAVYQPFDFVPCSQIGPSSDPGDRSTGTIWSASLTTLHEMTHWAELTIETAQLEIDDVVIKRPDGILTKAYESFYSMHVKDWEGARKPTTNADCYVMSVAEIFYSHLCPQLGPWQDPPPTDKIWPPTANAQIPRRI